MNALRRRLALALTAIAHVLLCSCIESHEEVWLEPDGSGRAEIRATLPAAVLAAKGGEKEVGAMIETALSSTKAFTRAHHEITTRGDRAEIRIEADFDSAMDLIEVTEGPSSAELPPAVKHMAGTLQVAIHGRTLDFKRTISPGKALPGAGLLPASALDGGRLVTVVHLPAAAFDHNATRVENQGRTLVWEIPLAQAVRKPMVTRFRMDIPIPWHLVAGIAIPLILGSVWLIRRRARRKA